MQHGQTERQRDRGNERHTAVEEAVTVPISVTEFVSVCLAVYV